jgi:hypothetical protein
MVYWQILRAITPRIALMTVLLIAIPVGIRLYGLFEPNPIAIAFALAFLTAMTWFVGGLVGSAVANLMGAVRLRLIPAYRRRLLSVVVVLGLCLWSLVPLLLASSDFDPVPIPWLRWAPLWSYGLMGLGFVGGFCAPEMSKWSGPLSWSRLTWTRTLPFAITWMLPVVVVSSESLRRWLSIPLDAGLPGFTPLAVLCLLVGPLSWPAIVSLLTAPRQDSPVTKRDWESQLRSGNGNAWSLSAVASRLHGEGRLRIEFLVFRPPLLSLWTSPWFYLIAIAGVLLWFALTRGLGGTGDVLKMNLEPFLFAALTTALAPVYAGAIDVQRLGRSLLLPGQGNRATLPSQLFARLLWVWIGGVAVAMAPVAGIALWSGITPIKLGLFAFLISWGICCSAAVTFYRTPSASRKTVANPVDLGLGLLLMSSFMLAKTFFFDVYSVETCLSVIALAFVIPVALYRQGLKRWHTMEYGA